MFETNVGCGGLRYLIMGLLAPQHLMMLMSPTSSLLGVCLTPLSVELAMVERINGIPELRRYSVSFLEISPMMSTEWVEHV